MFWAWNEILLYKNDISKNYKFSQQSHDQSEENYNFNKETRIKTSMLRSDICDFSDAYIALKRNITVTYQDNAKRNKSIAFKNNAPFINYISKINGVQIGNAEDLNVVMPVYNLFEYSKNYRKTTGNLWNYYRDEPNKPLYSNSESFKYKTSITGNTDNVGMVKLVMMQTKLVKIKLKPLFH